MKVYNVSDLEFKPYGKILKNYDFNEVFEAANDLPITNDGIVYEASVPVLEKCKIKTELQNRGFGGMEIQIGYVGGANRTLNCLEYHKSSEINMANEEFILLIGERKDIIDGKYDLSKVEGFLVPKGVAVEMYANTLHYCPCGVDGNGFRMLVVLPKGTNVGEYHSELEPALRNANKWLFAHEDTNEARSGAYVGLVGNKIVL